MKKQNLFKLALMLLIAGLMSTSVYSQNKGNKTPEERAKMRADKLTSMLSLDASQSTQIYELFLEKHQQMAKDKEAYKNDKEAWKKMRKENHEAMKTKMQSILTAEQFTKLQEHKKEMRGKHKEKNKDKNKQHKNNKREKSE